jgi:long-chain fatty acid transport protein
MSSPLGTDGGAGFGWNDVTTVKAGLQWRAGKTWTWRAGYSIGDQPIPTSETLFNILAPGVVEQHLTAGFSREVGKGKAFHLSIMRALKGEVSGSNVLEAPGRQQIKLSMSQWEFEAGYSVRF